MFVVLNSGLDLLPSHYAKVTFIASSILALPYGNVYSGFINSLSNIQRFNTKVVELPVTAENTLSGLRQEWVDFIEADLILSSGVYYYKLDIPSGVVLITNLIKQFKNYSRVLNFELLSPGTFYFENSQCIVIDYVEQTDLVFNVLGVELNNG